MLKRPGPIIPAIAGPFDGMSRLKARSVPAVAFQPIRDVESNVVVSWLQLKMITHLSGNVCDYLVPLLFPRSGADA